MPDAAAAAPTIETIIDDAGPIQGQIARASQTDDATPTLKIALPATAQAGDTLNIDDATARSLGGPMLILSRQITADEATQRFALVTVNVGEGQNDFTAYLSNASGRGSSSAEYSAVVEPDGSVRTTPLANGGKVLSYTTHDLNGYESQLYDANGAVVGATVRFGGDVGSYDIAAQPGFGYVLVGTSLSPGGSSFIGEVVRADGSVANNQLSFGGREHAPQIVTAGNGDFVVTGTLEASDPQLQNAGGPLLWFFDAAGNRTVEGGLYGAVMVPGSIQSITADQGSHLLIKWQDGPASGTMDVDTVHPGVATPPTPTVTVLDDHGAAIAGGSTTSDATPTFRIAANQTGQAFVSFGRAGEPGTIDAVQITAADVTRGYIDVTETATKGDGAYTAKVEVADSTGSASKAVNFNFTLQSGQSGQTLRGQDGGSNLQGGAGDDTLIGGAGPDTMTGAGGGDHFVFQSVPWNPGHITDFTHGTDKLDLSALLSQAGYTGSDPIADGYVRLYDDGQGDSWLHFDSDGRGTADEWGSFIATLDHVAPSGVTSADLVGSASPPDDAAAIRSTQLTDGNRLDTYGDSSWTVHAVMYDSSGAQVGTELQFRSGPGFGTAGYQVNPLANGRYLLHFPGSSGGGSWEELRVVDANNNLLTSSSSGAAQNVQVTVDPAGGFVVTGRPSQGDLIVQYEPAQPLFKVYDNSGEATATGGHFGWLMLAGALQSVRTDSQGHVLLNWQDGSAIRTLTIDPADPGLSTPATPAMTVLDDAGPQTGAISADASTDDTTPTFRVNVSQTGELFVQFSKDSRYEFQTQGVPVTDTDLARGYVDVTPTAAQGDGTYYGFARVTDPTGSSSDVQRISFTVQSAASPPPPSGGQTLQGQPGGSHLTGGSGDDTLIGGSGPDVMTGAAGGDHFAFQTVPWSAAEITDFTHGSDKLDLSALLSKAGYSGSHPVADGYVKFLDDGQGDTWLYFDATPSTNPWGDYVATIQHVPPASLSETDLVGSTASPPPPPPPSGGETLQGQPGGSQLTGGSGDDTLSGGTGPDTMAGAAGADHFTFDAVPWHAAQITDFTHGSDKLDLSALLSKAGYSGADPVADGYVKFLDDGQGDTWLYFDATPASNPWGDYVATLQHVSPSSLGAADLVGTAASPPPPPPAGQTLQGQAGGSNLKGGAGDDTLIGGVGPDTMTGAGGADHFVYQSAPWQGGQITDFTNGTDKIDVSGLLAGVHYSGSDPIADGYVRLYDNGSGGTWLYFDSDGPGTADQWGTFVANLSGVSPSRLTGSDFIFH